MRVLMLSWEYPPHLVGGLGKHVEELLPALVAVGPLAVDLLTPNRRDGELHAAVGSRGLVTRVPPPPPTADILETVRATAPMLVAAGLEQARDHAYDLVHAHDWLVSEAAGEISARLGLPLVATIHATERGRNRGTITSDLSRAIDRLEEALVARADALIACSDYMAGQIADYFHCPQSSIFVIPNGVDTSRFERIDPTGLADFRHWFAAPEEGLILCVARLVREKGVHLLLEAMPRVLASVPRAKLVVAGTGPESEHLRELANHLGLGAKVYFTGFVPDDVRDRLYKVADVAAFPSLYEPFGIVALEAMAAGAPVVVADSGGLGEVVQHLENGLTARWDSAESLGWAIIETLGDPFAARARGLQAFRKVVERYAWPRIAEQTTDVYRATLAAVGSPRQPALRSDKPAHTARPREKKRHGPAL